MADPTTKTAEFRTLDESSNLQDNYVNPYYLEDLKRRVSVARVNGVLAAFDDLCTCTDERVHSPLSAGLLSGTTLMCQSHGSQWNVLTGELLRGPATKGLVMYTAREQDGKLQVRV